MRAAAPRGGGFTFIASVSPGLTAAVPGGVANVRPIDVPTGHVAIVTATALLIPSGNTLTMGVMVDGSPVNETGTTTAMQMTSVTEVPAGRHTIGVSAKGSNTSGAINTTTLTWVIVRKDSDR